MTEPNSDAVRNILLASPPGQFDLILEDLRALLPKASTSSLLGPGFVSDVRSEWESATGLAAANGDSGVDGGDACIASLSKAVDGYLARKFSSLGVRAGRAVTASSADGGARSLDVATYSERIDMNNQHAGSWRGRYAVCPSTGSLSGSVVVRAHTFENGGNVQLNSTVSLGDADVGPCPDDGIGGEDELTSWAEEVVLQIESWEEEQVMEKLSGMYESMGKMYLKSLRRVMPITRTKMEWNVMAHRVVQTLGEGHNKQKFKH